MYIRKVPDPEVEPRVSRCTYQCINKLTYSSHIQFCYVISGCVSHHACVQNAEVVHIYVGNNMNPPADRHVVLRPKTTHTG